MLTESDDLGARIVVARYDPRSNQHLLVIWMWHFFNFVFRGPVIKNTDPNPIRLDGYNHYTMYLLLRLSVVKSCRGVGRV